MLKKLRKHMGDKLDIFIYGSECKYEILTVGCEDEEFTEKLLKRFPKSNIDIIDESLESIENINKKIEKNERINYIHRDIECHICTKKYDLIFSNCSFYKVKDFQGLLEKLYRDLNYGGKIIFSTIVERVHRDNIRESFVAYKYVYPEEIKNMIEDKYRVLIIDEEIIREKNHFSADLIYIVLEKL